MFVSRKDAKTQRSREILEIFLIYSLVAILRSPEGKNLIIPDAPVLEKGVHRRLILTNKN
jgi:hypothetical protein